MESNPASVQASYRQLVQQCPLSASAPFEIHGAWDRGWQPGDDYHYQGYRYIPGSEPDVLVREDVISWLAAQC